MLIIFVLLLIYMWNRSRNFRFDHELDIYNFMLVTLLLSQQTTVESANYDSESYNVLALVPVTIKNKVQPMHIANLVQQSIKV